MRDYREFVSEKTLYFELGTPFKTEFGGILPEVRVAYRSWGRLNEERSNVILICHALTGSADADIWWKAMFSEGGAFDEREDFVVCSNVLGGCYGTTGPLSIDPCTGRRYGPDFPPITIRDMVHLQRKLLAFFGIEQVKLVVGASLGGMQALEWGFLYPGMVRSMMPMGISGRHSSWCIAQSEAQRQAIFADRDWNGGRYEPDHPPAAGLAAARMMAMCSYRSFGSFQSRFGRTRQENGRFSVENYLRYQGDKLVDRFDANTYVTLTRAMDTHDLSRGRGEYEQVLRSLGIPVRILSIRSDMLYLPEEQEELGELLPGSSVIYLDEPYGHDSFLIDVEKISRMVCEFRQEVSVQDRDVSGSISSNPV